MIIELRELLYSGAIRRHPLGAKDLLTSTSPYKRKVCEEKAFTDFFCADIEKMVLYKTGKSLYN